MSRWRDAFAISALKLRRAVVLRAAVLIATLAPPLAGTAAHVLAASASTSPMAAKARGLAEGEGGTAVAGLVAQISSVATFLAVGMVVAWAIGRELTDHTAVTLYALPIGRGVQVMATHLLLAGVTAGIAVGHVALTLLAGAAVGSVPAVADLARLGAVTLVSGLGALPLGWTAGVLRGYLGGISALLGLVIATQVAVGLGVGAWVPWAAATLWAGAAGTQAALAVTPVQLAVPVLLAAVGTLASARWWDRHELGT